MRNGKKRKERVFAVTGERRQLAPVLESSCVTSVCLDMEAYDRSTIMEELKEDANAVMQKDKEVYLAMPAYLPCRNGRMGAADTSGYKKNGICRSFCEKL